MHEYSQRQHVPFLLFQVSMYANEFFLNVEYARRKNG